MKVTKRMATVVLALCCMVGLAVAVSAQEKDIVDTAVGAGSCNTLVKALKAAGLVDTLKGPGPFTLFAPTDEAFAKLPKGRLEDLLKPENKAKLTAILTYHVVPGKIMAAEVVKVRTLKTLEGSVIKVSLSKKGDDKFWVGRANVVKTDVMATNGVIHVIDAVITPPVKRGESEDTEPQK
jgi:uncharacterized surface protein with fasciclin (FAS1) repeats